jgi:hypothetical protein
VLGTVFEEADECVDWLVYFPDGRIQHDAALLGAAEELVRIFATALRSVKGKPRVSFIYFSATSSTFPLLLLVSVPVRYKHERLQSVEPERRVSDRPASLVQVYHDGRFQAWRSRVLKGELPARMGATPRIRKSSGVT